jgi:hypothetical protein
MDNYWKGIKHYRLHAKVIEAWQIYLTNERYREKKK